MEACYLVLSLAFSQQSCLGSMSSPDSAGQDQALRQRMNFLPDTSSLLVSLESGTFACQASILAGFISSCFAKL